MTQIVLFMVLCSGLAGNQCGVIETPKVLFEDYRSCALYGYKYSYELMKGFDPEFINEMQTYTKFSCKVDKII